MLGGTEGRECDRLACGVGGRPARQQPRRACRKAGSHERWTGSCGS